MTRFTQQEPGWAENGLEAGSHPGEAHWEAGWGISQCCEQQTRTGKLFALNPKAQPKSIGGQYIAYVPCDKHMMPCQTTHFIGTTYLTDRNPPS